MIFSIRILGVVGILTIGGIVFNAPSANAQSQNGTCQQVTHAVRLAPSLPKNQTISGTFCEPVSWAPGSHDVDVMVHGATYSSDYWDWPTDYPDYSYVDRTLNAGRATFHYDRLGVGQSSRPLSALATVEADAYVLHQIVQKLRTDHNFDKVTTIGHSLGSVIAQYEASKYKDADRVVITGAIHAQGTGAVTILPSFYPAPLDPKFAGRTDLGYLTTLPGARSVFYNATASPQVIADDETGKDVVSTIELTQAFPFAIAPPILNITKGITAPVLSIVGEEDVLVCGLLVDCSNSGQVHANEVPYYANAASLTTSVVSNTGHSLTLHPSANTSFSTINAWIQSH